MLLLPDLVTFIKEFQAERQNIEYSIIVASDDRATELYKSTPNANDNCTIICVVPSHDLKAKDEDTVDSNNSIAIMVVKKFDKKEGNDVEIEKFALCQLEIKALAKKLIQYINSQENCIWKKTILSSISIRPIAAYNNANGYAIEFTSVTDFLA